MAKQRHSKFIRWFKPLLDVMYELRTASTKEVFAKIAEQEGLDDDYLSQVYPKTGRSVYKTEVMFAR